VSDTLVIQSHSGPYTAVFDADALTRLDENVLPGSHFIVDDRVARLYERELGRVLSSASILRVEASEANKSLERLPAYVDHLVAHAIRRHHRLIAIGGGVIQDITCFLAATLLRGVAWEFYPTTLLAQADSCIGSKSSINAGAAKNVLGTFTPPARIQITTRVLNTLSDVDRRSGIGEMLKVHAIAGPADFDAIAGDYPRLVSDDRVMQCYIRRSLEIKKAIIEIDEFDRGPRNVMNFGHSFGHALEAATDYGVPHGIAVTIGMDMANYVAARLEIAPVSHFDRMHRILRTNYAGFEHTPVPLERFLAALAKDKKNTDRELSLILPGPDGVVRATRRPQDDSFVSACAGYLATSRAS
jgi:3-dehydroquinate synthase